MFALKETIHKLNERLGVHRRTALFVLGITILAAVVESFGISLILPILQVIVDGALHGRLASLFNPLFTVIPQKFLLPALCSIFLFFLILKFCLNLTHIYFSKRFVWQIRLEWINRIFGKYLYANYRFFLENKPGVLLNNLIEETYRGAICLSLINDFIARAVLLAALYVPLLLIDWAVTLCLSIFLVVLLALSHNISTKFARSTGKKRLILKQQLSGWGIEGIGGARQIKIFGLEQWFGSKFSRVARKLYSVELRFEIIKMLPSYLSEVILGSLLVTVILYTYFYSDKQLSTLLPVMGVYVIIGQKMFSNISTLAGVRMQILNLLPSLNLSHDLCNKAISQERLDTGKTFLGLERDLRLSDVTFRYRGGKVVLQNFNMQITQGKMTALIGPSGAGKSTVADLLLGFCTPDSGEILINGNNLNNWQLASWRKCIGYVSQEPYLFNMSIRENIALAYPEASEKDIIAAAKKAYAHDFIQELPDGYDTQVGDRGMKLSGGQRQRIAIARAIIRNPDFYIFDEATSALDKESERVVQKAMEELAEQKTILVIAHRLSTIEKADFVYDLQTEGHAN